MKICEAQKSFDVIGWSLWEEGAVALALPAEINCSLLKTGDLRIKLRFLLLKLNGAE